MDRATLAQTVHRRLRALAEDAGLSTTASGSQTEGDYTDAIDAALRALGLVDPDTGALDISFAQVAQHNSLIGMVSGEMLVQLEVHYATLTDIKVGDREEKLSQIRAAVRALGSTAGTVAAGAGSVVAVRKLTRRADDYELL